MECEGLCTAPLIYLARDVTDGPPKHACLYAVTDWVNRRFSSWGFYMGVLGAFTCLITILSCCAYKPEEEYKLEEFDNNFDQSEKKDH